MNFDFIYPLITGEKITITVCEATGAEPLEVEAIVPIRGEDTKRLLAIATVESERIYAEAYIEWMERDRKRIFDRKDAGIAGEESA